MKNLFKNQHLLACFLYIIVIVSVYLPVVFLNRTLLPFTLWTEGVMTPSPYGYQGRTLFVQTSLDPCTAYNHEEPINKLVADLYKRSELPLWNPYQASGYPLAADFSSRVFFPYQIIENFFPSWLWDYFLLGRLLIAGFFTYLFLRALSLSFASSFLGGAFYMLSGAMIWFLNVEEMVNGAMLLPALLLCIENFFKTSRFRYIILSGITAGLIFLGGHPTVALHIWTFSALYFIFHMILLKKDLAKNVLYFCALFVTAVLISLPLLLLFVEYMSLSHHLHSGIRAWSFNRVFTEWWGYHVNQLFMIVPTFFGQYLECWAPNVKCDGGAFGNIYGYSGLIVVYLVIIGLLSFKHVEKRAFFLFFSFCALLFTLSGSNFLLFVYIRQLIPVANKGFSGRWVAPIVMFPLSVAAAVVAESVCRVPVKRAVLAFLVVCILFFVLGFPGISYLVKFLANLDGLARSSYVTELTLISALGSIFVAFGSITLVLVLISKCQKGAISSENCLLGLIVLAIMELWFYIPKGYVIIDVGLTLVPFATGLIGVIVFSRRPSKRSLCLFLGLALLGFVSIDCSSKWGYPRKADIFSEAPYVTFLKNREDINTFRILGFGGVLGPNYASSAKLQDVRFYTAMSVGWYWYFVKDILMGGKEPTAAGIIKFSPAGGGAHSKDWDDYYQFSKTFRYYCLLGVKYILTWRGMDLNRHFVGQELPMIYNDEITIYENPYAFPKAFMTYKVVSVSSWEEAQERLQDMDITGLKEVGVVEEKPPTWFQFQGGNNFSSEIKIIKYEENQILLEVNNEKSGLLVLNDVYYPGWRAYTNGRETNIYRVDGLFRGIFLREGRHQIIFKYRPLSFRKFEFTQLFGQFVN